jgi:hypothetical protein
MKSRRISSLGRERQPIGFILGVNCIEKASIESRLFQLFETFQTFQSSKPHGSSKFKGSMTTPRQTVPSFRELSQA